MGQYYRVLEKEGNKRLVVYNRNIIVDGKEEYMMAKLTEHSWIGNWLMETVCNKIYNSDKPVRLIWMGDYADDFANDLENTFNGLTKKQIINYRNAAWGEPDRSKAVERAVFDFEGKYIVNHTKKEYVDFSLYYKTSVMNCAGDKWCMHPLSLLTAIGNGYGGGDYRSPTLASTVDLVGYWAWDEINITDNIPENYELLQPIFKETGWEETEE